MNKPIRIALLGGGPSALFMLKRLLASGRQDLEIHIFEKSDSLGKGMPYSHEGANSEHITNVSGNEIPAMVTPVHDWIHTVPDPELQRFRIDADDFNDYKVLPRLLFGEYLEAQFELLLAKAKQQSIPVTVHLSSAVIDIVDYPAQQITQVYTEAGVAGEFDRVVICTGHRWPLRHEGKVPRYFDSPYPPAKLRIEADHPVAIRGSSLTAIDAIRTLAREHGCFERNEDGQLSYKPNEAYTNFRMVMHSRAGLLPAVRFHLDDSHLAKDSVLSEEEVHGEREKHDGFLPLDYVFERNFKEHLRDKEPEFYEKIRDMQVEEFVQAMMDLRENLDPFTLLRAEYVQAEKSIRQQRSVYWKEMLAVLSFAMNYPAKYFSAEDMLRLQKSLMPLISIVIAFVPQGSVEEMLALHDAGKLDLVAVGDDSEVKPVDEGGAIYTYTDEAGATCTQHYKTFVDCIGQPHLGFKDLPYQSLVDKGSVSQALLRFSDPLAATKEMAHGNKKVVGGSNGDYYLSVPGVAINDHFQVMDAYGAYNPRIFMMAVPYIAGYKPDYSGLDFCEAASARIAAAFFED